MKRPMSFMKSIIGLMFVGQIFAPPMSTGESVFETWKGSYKNPGSQKEAIDFRTPTTLWGAAQKKSPRPTNRWFTTLAIRRPDKPAQDNETFPVNVFPYILNLTNQGIQMGYQDKKTLTPDHDHVLTVFLNNFEFSAVEPLSQSRRIISSVVDEPFSVTFQWGDEQRKIVAPLVHGMPFVTVELTNVTPKFSTMHAILDVNGKGNSGSDVGTKYKIRMNNDQTWFIFTSAPLGLTWNGPSLIADKPFTGIVRIIEYAVPAGFMPEQNMAQEEFGAKEPHAAKEQYAKKEEPVNNSQKSAKDASRPKEQHAPQAKQHQQDFNNAANAQPKKSNVSASAATDLLQALELAQLLKPQPFTQKSFVPKSHESTTSASKSPAASQSPTNNGFVQSFQVAPPLPPNPADPAWSSQLPTIDAFQKRFFDQDLPALKTWYKNTYGKDYDQQIQLSGNTPAQMYQDYVQVVYNPLFEKWKIDREKVGGGIGSHSCILGRLSDHKQSNVEQLLERYKNAYPVSGSVSFAFEADKARIMFNWKTKGSGELLMLCLPHHRDMLQNPQYVQDITYNSIRGQMVGIVGTSWTLQESLPNISWDSVADIPEDKIPLIKEALKKDQSFKAGAADSYSFGKEVAKMLRLALIAYQLKEYDIAKTILRNVKEVLTPWVMGTNVDKLVYDSEWGGVCTIDGMQDAGADYGVGWYNDHHFHWGYFIYAAGAFIHLAEQLQMSALFNDFVEKLVPCMHDLIRDIANPKADESFPDHRFMDWYLGHTLASGLFPFGDGKNQESTSEAVNAWYGIYLFGMATKNKDLEQLGKILTATEIRGAHTYWQMKPDSKIYPKEFATRTCVGILWEMKADYATWFGSNVEYIHLIQYLPFTPITELLIPKAWNSLQYPLLKKALNRMDPIIMEQWKGYLYMSQAISDQEAAWKNVQGLNVYDNGNTATNTLYWVATRR